MKIDIDSIDIAHEDSVCNVWLGRTSIEPIQYFSIQYDSEPDDQDMKLGMDTFYIEMNDQLFSCYGGVKGIKIDQEKMIIRFDQVGKEKLKLDHLELDLSSQAEKFNSLSNTLEIIFSEEIKNKSA